MDSESARLVVLRKGKQRTLEDTLACGYSTEQEALTLPLLTLANRDLAQTVI